MSCPYFEEGYAGSCSASETTLVPSIERMETYCFKPAYRLCPVLSECLFEADLETAACSQGGNAAR
ncbi:MAG: hypothetical protein C0402_01575 [Thermodesulfovibrio sp.]|nr:hypothetical protein [Thermodesulfovibrio sp.]